MKMTYLVNEPATWMPLMGVVTFFAVHGAMLAIVLSIG
jgi:hypothetical protein